MIINIEFVHIPFGCIKKKFFLIILPLFVICFNLHAQEHLKFMGIPIDGNVSKFQKRMEGKGFFVSGDNEYAPKGIRIMDGVFTGLPCQICIRYDVVSNTLFSVMMRREYSTEDEAKKYQVMIQDLLKEKYSTFTLAEYREYGYTIYKFHSSFGDIYNGMRFEKLSSDEDPNNIAETTYVVRLEYNDQINCKQAIENNSKIDKVNKIKERKRNMDDL